MAAREDEMDLAIVDAAPHAAPDATRIARLATLVAIPCRPSAFDLAAVEGAVRIVKAADAKAVLVLSACPFRAPEIAEARDALRSYGLPVSPMEITDRKAFARAICDGRGSDRVRNRWTGSGWNPCPLGMDTGADGMSAKPTGLAAFTRSKDPAKQEELARPPRKRAQGDTVALTVRIPRAEWARLHQLAVAEGVSLQALALDGLSRVFREHGLPPITSWRHGAAAPIRHCVSSRSCGSIATLHHTQRFAKDNWATQTPDMPTAPNWAPQEHPAEPGETKLWEAQSLLSQPDFASAFLQWESCVLLVALQRLGQTEEHPSYA
jgi:hypothetical protein